MNKLIFFFLSSVFFCACTEKTIPLPVDSSFGYETAFFSCKKEYAMHGYQDSLFSKELQKDKSYEDIANKQFLELPYGDRSKKLFKYFLGIDDSINYLPPVSFYGASSFFNRDKKVSEPGLQYWLKTKLYWNYQYEAPKNKACLTIIDAIERADSTKEFLKYPREHNHFQITYPCERKMINIISQVKRGIDERYGPGAHGAIFGPDELAIVFNHVKKKNIGKITNYINLINALDSTGWSRENIESSKEFQMIVQNFEGYHFSDPIQNTGHKDDFTDEEIGNWFNHTEFPEYPKMKFKSKIPTTSLEQEQYILDLFLMDTIHRVDAPFIPVTIKVKIKHAKLLPPNTVSKAN